MDASLPTAGIAKYKAAFDVFDTEGKGRVKAEDFKSFVATALGVTFPPEATDMIVNAMEPDEDGMISFEGFMKGFSSRLLGEDHQVELYKTLVRGASGGQGIESMADWGAALARLGVVLPEEEVQAIMKEAQVSARELLAMEMNRAGRPTKELEEEVLRDLQKGDGSGATGEKSEEGELVKAVMEKLASLEIGKNLGVVTKETTSEFTKEPVAVAEEKNEMSEMEIGDENKGEKKVEGEKKGGEEDGKEEGEKKGGEEDGKEEGENKGEGEVKEEGEKKDEEDGKEEGDRKEEKEKKEERVPTGGTDDEVAARGEQGTYLGKQSDKPEDADDVTTNNDQVIDVQ